MFQVGTTVESSLLGMDYTQNVHGMGDDIDALQDFS